jgi:hypothetical protein
MATNRGRHSARLILTLAALLGVAGCGSSATSGQPDGALPPGEDGGLPGDDASTPGDDTGPAVTTVGASQNLLALDSCQVTPATLPDVPAGTYTITLETSTLSKGNVATSPPTASVDNYVIVQLPLSAGDPQEDHRFFMLNGIGDSYDFTLATPGTIQVMFVDSDVEANAGEATVGLTPGGLQTTVDAVANVLRWRDGCSSNPAMIDVNVRPHDVKLLSSTLEWGGLHGDYVLLRMPSEVPQDDYRYVILNGVDASHAFSPNTTDGIRAWFISPTASSTGQAILALYDR